MSDQDSESSPLEGIAVVGLAGRFPGADDLTALWRNLCAGAEAITFYSREELAAAGVEAELLDDPRYVRAAAALRDVQSFDAGFFGFSPREAELMDPQQRLFLECCWEALESAGYDTETYAGAIGIFAGMGMSGYLLNNLLSHRDLIRTTGALQVRVLNDNNYLTSMAAYKLDLRGPSVTVQSACSTSLVAVCMASQSLLQYQCDMVLAGGVTVVVPHAQGYLAQESVMSPDGHCRAFDAGARGTVEGSGAGVVVLKRLSDAVADGDTIHAVIRGFATNNDGGFKQSFTAPSQDGQLEVVAMAQAMAGVPAESITYVEAHGTGTPLGDPVEVAALTEVFAASTARLGFCALGSIKTNIGHLDAAAGIAGLIKAVLAVEHGVIPPSLHFETPNPRIDFAHSPFYVNTECRPWRPEGWPRRAGVSAFAIGGVNAHVIVEEPPVAEHATEAPPWQLLVLSARTETALDAMTGRLLGHLREPQDQPLADIADIAYTLQVGRRAFRHRRLLVCRDREDAAGVLERRDPRRLLTGTAAAGEPQVAFLFPGLGTEYIGMAHGLYRDDAGFRARLDDCAERLLPLMGVDLREVLFPGSSSPVGEGLAPSRAGGKVESSPPHPPPTREGASPSPTLGLTPGEAEGVTGTGLDLRGLLGRSPQPSTPLRTAVSQPVVFAVEYALAGRLLDWGIKPQAMVGFSLGEYVAACLSGVLSLDDALRLVAGRARLIDELPAGAMLAVPLNEAAVAPWLVGGLSLAAVAGPELTVLAGTEEAIASAEERLTAAGHVCRRLQTTHAFHSSLMEPAVAGFLALFEGIELRSPEIPYLSNVTGTWITAEQATDPEYWAEHLRGTVRFADAVSELWREPGRVMVEVGPGQTLGSWALQHPAAAATAEPLALPTLRHAFERTEDLAFLLQTVGRLWLTGLRPDWPALWADWGEQPRRRVPLPTYPFERQRYWIDPAGVAVAPTVSVHAVAAPAAEPTAASARRHSRPNLHVSYAPPRDATERRLVEILGELLRVEEVGIHDGFFDLGGDSLLATHLVARLNQELGAELTLRSIFESPAAAELAAAIAAHQGTGAVAWGPVLRRAGDAPLPLSFAQRRLWFLDQLDPGNPAYNVPAAVLLTGPLDRQVLAASLDEVVARHEALRTTFTASMGNEEPLQRIAAPAPLAFPCIDLMSLPEDAREAEALRLAAVEALRPFDLTRGPLLRAALLRLGAERHVALFTMHHMVGDGWSADLMVRELAALYPALAGGRPSPLPPLPVQYADFVLWQRDNLRGAELESQLAFWRGALAGAPAVLDLPSDRPRPARLSGRGGAVAAELSAAHVDALKAVGRRAGATPFMTLLAAFYALLHRLTGETDLVVGTPVANRRRPELEGLIGFFANTLVLRAVLPQNEATFAGLLAAVRESALSAYSHQDLPFERLVEELAPERSLAHSPLFQVSFLLHGVPIEDRALSGLTLSPFGTLAAAERAAKFDLTLELVESGPGLTALLEFRRDLFDGTTAARLLGQFSVLAGALASSPELPLSEVPLLTEGDRHQILAEWNDTSAPVPQTALLHQLFEAVVERSPQVVAAVCAGEELSYGNLDARSNRLAHLLRRQGIGRGAPVGVWIERSLDMLTAVLGVLKAGAHYVALDESWPVGRVESILAASGVPAVITGISLLGAVEEMRWRLPALGTVICPAIAEAEPPSEAIDPESVRELWDLVAERAVDRITAGGFVSAFTGEPMSEAEVDEYRDRVLSLAAPWLRPEARVLEIGNGSGLLLWEIASRVSRVTGVDPSPRTQERNRERAAREGVSNVDLLTGFAHEVDSLLGADERFDLILLASTVQFFPGPRYLDSVVRQALGRLAPDGALLIADVPDARRREDLRRAIEEHRGVSNSAQRRELFVDEGFFLDLGGAVHHRTEGFANELRFRYDVLLTQATSPDFGAEAPRSHPAGSLGDPKDLGDGKVRPPRSFPLAGLALRMTGQPEPDRRERRRVLTGWHLERCRSGRLSPLATGDDIAYVIHTSGSTGEPKGIAVQHRPAVNLVDWVNRTFEIGPRDRGLFVTSLAFDLSVYDIFGVLGAGGTVHVATRDELADPDRLVHLLRSGGITLWDSAPAALVQLAPLFPAVPEASSRLRRVLLSGDWIPVTLPDRVRQAFPGARVLALGGATEATVWSNWFPVGVVDPAWPSIPYGRPIANARYHVLDAGFSPCPIGVPGDLYIGGDCLCVGYARRPELTAAAFVPDPFAVSGTGARLYRTGDRARYHADGNMEFLGRLDQQVKVRGFRIELGEIEAVLASHPGVRDCAVAVREDVPGDRRLVAYIVGRTGGVAGAELRSHLQPRLPEYMIPSAFVTLETLPLTANGKLDRKALPAPERAEAESFTAPSGPVEELLAGIWSEVLGLERVGAHDSFFDLGGHSLLATQVVSRIRGAFQVELPLRVVFENPTVAALAAEIGALGVEGGAAETPPLVRFERVEGAPLALSFAQQRLWFLDQLAPGSPLYNIPAAIELKGRLDPGALAAVLSEVVRRHETLRTRFAAGPEGAVQVIDAAAPVALAVADLSGLPLTESRREEARLTEEEALRPFDLARGPLLRTLLLRRGEDDWALSLTMHHIVSDGWSMGVLIREVGALYGAFVAGRPSPLPELAIQYADFAAWQRRHLAGDLLARELAWWRRQLAGMPQEIELPADRPRPIVASARGAVHGFAVGEETLAGLNRLSRQHGATLFMTLLAGFAALLQRVVGDGSSDELAVGTPIAGRTRVETEPLIGFFVNTLVLRMDVSGDPDLVTLLGRVRETTLSAYAHQELPFERLVEELAPERHRSRPPLVQVMLALQNAAAGPLELPGLELQAASLPSGTAKLDVTVILRETAEGLAGEIEYSRDLFDRATIVRLAGRFARLLAAFVADPQQHLADLPLLSAVEQQQALAEWNDTASGYPREACLPELFAAVARELPEAPAIVAADGVWSYRRLDAASSRLARHLRSLGVGPGTPVCLAMERSPELIVGILAILMAGGTYVPLDTGYPDDRLDFMLADVGAAIVLVHAGTRERLAGWEGRVSLVAVDAVDESGWEGEEGSPLEMSLPAESAAYVIYTSGSTGQPKGVAVPHRAIVRLVRETDYVRLGPGDRVAQVANISFDAATWEIWGALLNGAAVVVIPRDVVLSPPDLAAALREGEVTSLFLTTALFNRMVREVPDAFQGVRDLLFGGEAADPAMARAVLTSHPPRRLLHVYGPTESTTFASWHLLREVPEGAVSLPIGGPLANTTLHVLDRRLAASPPGTAGELWIGGEGLAWGYWNRPELTAERFVPDPNGRSSSGGRLYRTGDLVRRLPDGALDFLGRIDQQVKIRGFRVEPGEIEAVLLAHPQVRAAAVLPREDAVGGLILAAYVVMADEGTPETSELRRWLQERLPAFMLPTAWAFLPALPLTANGKVDRKALAKLRPERDTPAGGGARTAPRTPTEELVAGIFAEVLRLERAGAEDDFFALGGHSLLATQVASRVLSVLGVELPLRTVFETPTVAGLAAWIDERSSPAAAVPLVRVSREEPLVLSFAQLRLWFLDQMEPGSPLYNVPLAVELKGRLDPAALSAVLGEVVRRHESLRTRFAAGPHHQDGPVQVIDTPAPATLAVADLSGLPVAESRREEARLAREESLRPFDLARGPLLRTLLVHRGEDDWALSLTMHHIVSDGWSMGVLIREVGLLYAAFLAGRPSPLPELAFQYADFAAWQRRYLAGDRLERELSWWRGQLAEVPAALELPVDHPRPAVLSVRGGAHSFAIGGETLAGLARLSRRHGATLFMTLLAGFAALLWRVAGEGSADELAVGTPIAGRTRMEIEPLIGFFVNTLVLRADLSGDPDAVTLLDRVREATLAAYAHQELPFERLVEELAPERDRSRAPLVQVLFALQNSVAGPVELPGLAMKAAALPSGTAKFDLMLVCRETAEGPAGLAGLVGDIEYSRDLFESTTIERLAGRFVRLLDGIVAAPYGPLSGLPLLSAAERHEALVEHNDTATAYPREASLPELFAAVVGALPDAPAIVVPAQGEKPAEVWTYRRLDAASNRLARHLEFQGVGPQTPVCLAMERSPELIVGILAIVKAGGLYVPLDAGYPDERLVFMLVDSGASVVLVHAETLPRLAGWVGLVTMVAVDGSDWQQEDDSALDVRLPADSAAYVIYTSGSTGQPKGVVVPHRAIVRLVRETDYVRLGPGDRMGQVASISFDAATWEIWGALLNGAAVVVIPRDVALAPLELAAALREQEVTSLFLTAALFNRMAREVPDAFRGVRDLLYGGEAADPPAVRAVLETAPPRRLLNGYGPTESTTFASWHLVREVPEGATSLPIGAPLANTTLFVLDRRLAPSPSGTPGELWIGGDGLAWGYWNRPELTAERFVPAPSGLSVSGGRLYRTGDLVRRPPGGALDFLGRIDQQVKIRGFRVEPGEIEAALLAHPQVRSAVVLPRLDAAGGLGLAAYVVVAPHAGAPGAAELRQWLLERLPAFMLPAAWVLLPSLPLTANGKVDRKALAKLRPEGVGAAGGSTAGAAPWTPTEEMVAGIFAEVLSLDKVELEDDFFALGGHSLLATQVASRVRSVFGLEMPVRVVFEAPTAAGLAREVEKASGLRGTAPPLARAGGQEARPLSFAQQRLWFIDQMDSGSLYNISVALRMSGTLSVAVLAQAVQEVVRRHEVLRTVFSPVEGRMCQVVLPPSGFAFPLVDLTGLAAELRERVAAGWLDEEARRPFDLARGPLWRARLWRCGETEHLMLFSMHHIASDGWSMGVLVREVTALYAAFTLGLPSPLAELPLQYGDFAVWQRGWLSGDVLAREIEHWRRRLSGAPPVLDLPSDRPRPPVRSVRGSSRVRHLPPALAEQVHSLSRRQGATLFMTIAAGFQGWLARVTGQADFTLGTPIAGRNRLETESLIGFFVNTLVLRADLSGDPGVSEILARVRRETLEAYQHQDLPFEKLVEELDPERSLSRSPLFQVMLVLQNNAEAVLEIPGIELRPLTLPLTMTDFDLTLVVRETEQGLDAALDYRTDLFDATTVARLLAQLERLLAAAVEAPETRLSQLPLLGEGERFQVLAEWNDAGPDVPESGLLHEPFFAQAARTPERVAVICGEEHLSYGELAARATRLARELVALGAQAPQFPPAGILLDRGVERIVALLGVLLAGAPYLPLDPALPQERLGELLSGSGAALVVTREELLPRLASMASMARITAVCLDRLGGPGGAAPLAKPIPGTPAQAAYVLYTSGSTGRPKGVVVEHRAAAWYSRCAIENFALRPSDCALQFAALSFDVSIEEIFPILSVGGRLVIYPAGEVPAAGEFLAVCRAAEVTVLTLATAYWHELVLEIEALPDALPEALRLVSIGGEKARPDRVASWQRLAPRSTVCNGYGPTETTVIATLFRLGEEPWDPAADLPLGRPIRGARTYILDRGFEPLPPGVPGELAIGGAGLARGYLGEPGMTAERFVPDPFGAAGERLYRTGDLARQRPDGTFEFLGRIDHQVKLRGFRIEPGEIEQALAGLDGVVDAVVVLREGLPGGRGLVAYAAAAGTDATGPALRDALKDKLPAWMVPAHVVLLEALPLTPGGKLDRRWLAEHGPLPEMSAGRAARALTPTEELLADLFAEVLGVSEVGVDAGFFELGGHSLLATRLMARVRTAFGIEMPLRTIFEQPAVAGLAREIEKASRPGESAAAGRPAPVPRTDSPPLSFAQERLWFLQQLEPGSAAYNMPLDLELEGRLDPGALAAALAGVRCRHESLRTTFESIAGELRQRIAPPAPAPAQNAPVSLPLVDLSALPEAGRRSAADDLARWHAGWIFDLERGPLFVWLLVRLAGGRHRLLVNLHHTIADGWSIEVLARELGELYAATVEGRPARLQELPIQYADFAVWQRRWLAESADPELAYWESRLGGEIASAELPTDRPRPAIQTFRGGRSDLVLGPDLTARLKRFGRAESVTLFMTLLAATQALLARHSGEDDVAVGVPVAGRQWVETEELIGCFLNTLVLRTDTSGRPGFRALAARVRALTLEAYSHQNVPFEAVLARLDLHRDLSRSPLFQVLFNLLNLPAASVSLPGLELRALMPADVPSKLDLTFYISEVDPGIVINLVYNADLFDAARMDDFLAQLEMFLDAALEEPEAPVTALPLLTAAMRQVIPDPAEVLDQSWIGSVYELFAASAARAPERAAVAGEAGVQTYGALLAASRRVAGWLAEHGVRRGDPVAILAVRAAPLVEAVLGVLGAGGAFVMLDSAYPALRQLEMLRLASPRAWISFAGEEGAALPDVQSWLREAGCPCLELPTGGAGADAALAPFAAAAPEVRVGPEDIACIGFTSGSTGGPKGILGRHGPLSHFLPTHCRQFGLGADDRFSLLSGLGHDPLQREIFTPLYLGATIVVPQPSAFGISGRLAAWLCREQVTVSHLTPTLSQLLTELPLPSAESKRELAPSLRRVLLVGESLTRKDVARLRSLAPEVSCINLYGSTETQRAVAFHVVTAEEAEVAPGASERAQQVLPLGRGVPDVQLLVINPEGGLAGLGELGEIAVRSPHLARGYLGNAELTAQRFQANPFASLPADPADRIYRTGDLGRYRADGEVVFAGRADQQVKLRGFRIELGEIEGVLASLPEVSEAVVLLRTDLPGGAGLVAYVRTEEGREHLLRGELEARLPSYMVPAAFVRLDRLPRNANGKVDRHALLRIAPELGAAAVLSLPRTPAEDLLAGIWSQVLGVEQIGVDQSFFELGGHSLLATQMASRVRDVFGVELPLRSLFLNPTLAGLAAEIERLRSGGAPERPTISSFRQDRAAPPPLSFAQERYWAGRHLEALSVASTIPMMIHLAGPLDRGCLRQAIAAVVERHEQLRTSFRDGPEGAIQVIHPEVPVVLREVDLERIGDPGRMEELMRLAALDGRLHFDYERPPLFRATLFRGGPEEHVLLFTIHHVASDWWSTPILINEVAAHYLAFRTGRPSPLPPLPAQFQDFARWQRRLSVEEAQASQVAFWREHLSGAVPIDLSDPGRGRPRPHERTFTAGMEEVLVPEELERRLDAFSAQQGVTLFMTLLAAFKVLLHFETGKDDLVVPCSFANRNQLETEGLIGNLATALPLRTRFAGLRTFRELLQQVRDVTLLAHDNSDIFWEPVVEGMTFREEGDRGGLVTFRVLLQLLKVPRAAQPQPQEEVPFDVRITPLPVDTGMMRLDLSLFLSQGNRLSGRFRYSRDVIAAERVRKMRDRFLRILAAVVANPEHPLAGLPPADPVPEEPGLA